MDWLNFLEEFQQPGRTPEDINANFNLSNLRSECYKEIERIRERPLIVYASRFVTDPVNGSSIELSDVDAFIDLVRSVPSDVKAIDVLLHSPGGDAAATERIVNVLRQRFNEVHFLIPHSAYSAATMLALSGDTITLGMFATLGPIDPQINGIPARSIINGFNKVKKEITPETISAYIPLLERITVELLEICSDAAELSKELVETWLASYMFRDKEIDSSHLGIISDYFADYERHLTHSRPIFIDKISSFGLKIYQANNELDSLLWDAYIQIEGYFSLGRASKLFENNYGVSWSRTVRS